MKAEIKKPNLLEDTYDYIDMKNINASLNAFQRQVESYMNILNEIIDADFDNLTDHELYELLTKVYDIFLEEEDYLKMLSSYNHKNYIFSHKIETTIITYNLQADDESSPLEIYQVYYTVAVASGFRFRASKKYSQEELKKLIDSKKIVILGQELISIVNDQDLTNKESNLLPTLNINIRNRSSNMSEFVNNNFELFGELLRKKFPKRIVLKDMQQIVKNLSEQIQKILAERNSEDYLFKELGIMCHKWFTTNKSKEYQNIKRRLRPTRK